MRIHHLQSLILHVCLIFLYAIIDNEINESKLQSSGGVPRSAPPPLPLPLHQACSHSGYILAGCKISRSKLASHLSQNPLARDGCSIQHRNNGMSVEDTRAGGGSLSLAQWPSEDEAGLGPSEKRARIVF
jgi:hypothetical protein